MNDEEIERRLASLERQVEVLMREKKERDRGDASMREAIESQKELANQER